LSNGLHHGVSNIITVAQHIDFISDNGDNANSVPEKTKVGLLYNNKGLLPSNITHWLDVAENRKKI